MIFNYVLSLQSLLDDPNPASPLNAEAASLWKENKELYKQKVVSHFKEYEKKQETHK